MPEAFSYAKAGLGGNVVVSDIDADFRAEALIVKKLKDMGQTHAINLTHKYADAAIALALYTGNGIVTKIIPDRYYNSDAPVLSMPPITSDYVERDHTGFFINTYPWIKPGSVTQGDVEVMRTTMSTMGFSFCNGDDRPDNVFRLPDASGTLVGIDSDMFLGSGNERHDALKAAWRSYLDTLYPRLYREVEIPIQSSEMNFAFTSAHDPNSGLIAFNPNQADPILMQEPEAEKSGHFWDRWFHKGKDTHQSFDM